MPATTPKGYPYPLGTEPVQQGDDAIKALALKADELLPARCYVGQGIVALTNVAAGSVLVTFPAGRFTVAPRVELTVSGTSVYFAHVVGVTATSVTVGARHYKDTLATTSVPVHVYAVQMGASTSDG